MKQWIPVVALVTTLAVGAAAQTAGTGQKGTGSMAPGAAQGTAQKGAGETAKGASADATFMRQAAMSSMAEVEHGRLATQNASAPDVKQFAQRMVDDHTKANEELKGIAAQKQVTLPGSLDQKHQAMHDKLAKSKGEAFDTAYMTHMVAAHQQTVTLFSREAKAGKDAEAKAFAAKTLPTLQEHLKMARQVHGQLAKGGGK